MAGPYNLPATLPMQPSRAVPAIIRDLGRADYEPVFAAMRAFTDARTADTPDELWIVEHPPVFTLGLGADRAHVLAPHDVPVVQTDLGIFIVVDHRQVHRAGEVVVVVFAG